MNSTSIISIDLGQRLGQVCLPKGSKIFFDGAIPILQKSIWFWNKSSLIIKSHLMDYGLECHLTNNLENQSNKLNYDVIIFEDKILDWLFNKETNPTVIFVSTPNIPVDYIVTVNGIFDCKSQSFIKQFEFLTENSKFINKDTGLDAISGRLGLSPTRLFTYRHIINNIKESEPNEFTEIIHSDLLALSYNSICIISNKNKYNYPEISWYSVKTIKDIENNLDFLHYAFDTMFSRFIPEESVPKYFSLGNHPTLDLLSELQGFFSNINEENIFNYVYSIDYVKNYQELLNSNKFFISNSNLKLTSFSSIFLSRIFKVQKPIKYNIFIDLTACELKCKQSCANLSTITNIQQIHRLFISNYSNKEITFGVTSISSHSLILYQHDVRHYSFKQIKKDNIVLFKCIQGGVRLLDITVCNSDKNSFILKNNQIIKLILESNITKLKEMDLGGESDFNSYNIFSLIALYSTNFTFAKNFFEFCIDQGFKVNNKDYNMLEILAFRNTRFNDSDLILFIDFIISNYNHLLKYDNPSILIKKILNIHNLPQMADDIKNNLIIKFFPIKLIDHLPPNEKLAIFNNIKSSDLVNNITIFKNANLNDICQELFKSKGKRIKKYYIENLQKDPISLIMKMKYVNNIFLNYDTKLLAISKLDKMINSGSITIQTLFYHIDKIQDFILQFKDFATNTKMDFFITNTNNIHLISDCANMAMEYSTKPGLNISINKFKSLLEFHEWLRIELVKIKSQKYLFNNSKITFLDNHKFKCNIDQYEFKIPESNHDIIKIGIFLKNCIGSDHYINRHKNLSHMVVSVFKNNQLYAVMFCELLFDHSDDSRLISQQIKEIKKKNNEDLNAEEISLIQNELLTLIFKTNGRI